MKWQLMTDGEIIAVVSTLENAHYKSIGFAKVGFPFDSWKHANEHADKLALAMEQKGA